MPHSSDAVEVHKHPGTLPRFWGRNAVFIANLLSLFFGNKQETEKLRDEVGALETYGGRLVPIIDILFTGGKNLLMLEREADGRLLKYFRDELGLGLPEMELLTHEEFTGGNDTAPRRRRILDHIRNHPAAWMDGFVTEERLVQTAELTAKQLISTLEGSKRGNNKLLLHRHLQAEGLPCFDTLLAEKPSDVPHFLADLRKAGYGRAVIKAQIGASGVGMIRMETASPAKIPDYLFHEGPCMVEGWLDDSVPGVELLGSPSVQMFVHDQRLHLYDITAQFLNADSVHEGNQSPPPYLDGLPEITEALLYQAEVAGRWLHGLGYRGTASADFHVVRRNGVPETRLCEINARVTGATYPAVLARRFAPEGAWLMRNVRFPEPRASDAVLRELDRTATLYRPGCDRGILPVNVNTNGQGLVTKAQLLALGKNPRDVASVVDLIRRHPSIKWNYDRD